MSIEEIDRVGSDDILYRLRLEEKERAAAIRLWRQNACGGSIQDDDHVHSLARDSVTEIVRLRTLLAQACHSDNKPT